MSLSRFSETETLFLCECNYFPLPSATKVSYIIKYMLSIFSFNMELICYLFNIWYKYHKILCQFQYFQFLSVFIWFYNLSSQLKKYMHLYHLNIPDKIVMQSNTEIISKSNSVLNREGKSHPLPFPNPYSLPVLCCWYLDPVLEFSTTCEIKMYKNTPCLKMITNYYFI
jgi:hypothetical protein